MSQAEVLRQYVKAQTEQRAKALDECERAYAALRKARLDYADAILAARAYGAGNTAIAHRVGLSETSIRSFIKRRESK